MAFKKVLTNISNGKLYINWSYSLKNGKIRNGAIELLAREIKTCDFINENDYKEMVRQNDDFYRTKKLIDNKISDSKKDQIAEDMEKKEHNKLKENAKEEETYTQDVKNEKGKKIGEVKIEVEKSN